MPFYAVARGRVPGIYETWEECRSQTDKFKSTLYKKFKTRGEAEEFISFHNNQTTPVRPLAKSTQFPSITSLTSTIEPCGSPASVIIDKVIRNKSTLNKISASISTSTKETNEIILLSDDEHTSTKPSTSNYKAKKITDNEDSVILLDNDDCFPVFSSENKTNGEKITVRTSPRQLQAKTNPIRIQVKPQVRHATVHNESRRKRASVPKSQASSGLTATSSSHDENRFPSSSNYNLPRTKGHVVVFTDGACLNNGRPNAKAGIGVWWGNNDPRNISEPLEGRQTNNRAEIWAAIRAINRAAEDGYDSITVCSDSDFLITSAKHWIFKWNQNGWILSGNGERKKKVANRDDFKQLIEAMKRIKVVWEKVKSHIGIPGNEEADRLANLAVGVKKRSVLKSK